MTEHHTQFKVQHPLDEETCKALATDDCGSVYYSYADMCSAADWQLEQVLNWLESELGRDCYGHEIDVYDVIEDLKQAMRPRQQEDEIDRDIFNSNLEKCVKLVANPPHDSQEGK